MLWIQNGFVNWRMVYLRGSVWLLQLKVVGFRFRGTICRNTKLSHYFGRLQKYQYFQGPQPPFWKVCRASTELVFITPAEV